jgi:hypothetical protein
MVKISTQTGADSFRDGVMDSSLSFKAVVTAFRPSLLR